MAKFTIDSDEVYPDYSAKPAGEGAKYTAELTDDEYADYLRVVNEYGAWQDRLGGMFDHVENARRVDREARRAEEDKRRAEEARKAAELRKERDRLTIEYRDARQRLIESATAELDAEYRAKVNALKPND